MTKRRFLVPLTIFWGSVLFAVLAVEPVAGQQPDGQSSDFTTTPEPTASFSPSPTESEAQPATPEPTATPSLTPAETSTPLLEPDPTATPLPEMTGLGLAEPGDSSSPAAEVSILALTPVNCAAMSPPVIGFEISKGQDPNDIADFANDLIASGFSLGTVDLSGGANPPPCVDVLIVYGLSQNKSLATPYTPAEGALLQAWAAAGHGLMLFGDWGPFRAGTDALFQTYGYSQQGPDAVTDPTDSEPSPPAPPPPNTWVIYQTDNFAGHPILDGVGSLELLAGSWLSPASSAIVTTDADADPPGAPVMAAFINGSGCVALSGDSNWIGVAGGGYFKQDNARVARQMVAWLKGCATLSLIKLASPSPVQAGGRLTYTLTAINNSATPLTNVTITDTVPVSSSFVSATGPFAGPDANGVVTWSPGSLSPGASATVNLVVQVDSLAPLGSIITNTAWVTSSEGLTDTATTFTPVNVQVVDPLVTKAVNTSQAQVGEVITFTLIVSQAAQSTSNATNVRVVDPLPPEVNIAGAPEVTAGFAEALGRVVTWTIPVLAPADVRVMTIRAQVNNASPPPLTIRNQATLRFDQGADRLSNQVEVFVPAAGPPPTSKSNGDDDDDDDAPPAPPPPPPPPPPATPVAVAQPAALPVTFLPETGQRAVELTLSQLGWSLALLLVGVGGVLFKLRSR